METLDVKGGIKLGRDCHQDNRTPDKGQAAENKVLN